MVKLLRMDETAEDHGIVKDRDVNNDIETSLSEQKVVCEEEKDVIANAKGGFAAVPETKQLEIIDITLFDVESSQMFQAFKLEFRRLLLFKIIHTKCKVNIQRLP
ncbi:uncharacterized protein LOC124457923 [Xenia sp. Carnegie-2017]|uniref:uncharacterized protein LOC124457923 n=1 Tax=Xenia sp. Carnegie-2017 TaxID=2897299 RepID=UPI001F04C13A|nr:uncharacterized protein LOC124457923 [Xenia sp. Carnegie-2017]